MPPRRPTPTLAAIAVGAWLAASGLAAGCSSPCTDDDGDGYGPGCSAGPDCDVHNALRNEDCIGVPAPDCDAMPTQTGCSCFSGVVVDCYSDDPATIGVGSCRAGTMICGEGYFGLCRREVLPGTETCNGMDDDCDGTVDEFVRSPCGGCDASCQGETWGPYGMRFVQANGLAPTPAGGVELDKVPPSFDGVWFPNAGDDTVSQLSAATGTEIGRHESAGDDPSRVAVDYLGDVFVTNRAFGAQGTLTKFAGTLGHCRDRDGSGAVETSTGPSDVPPAALDECLLYSVPIGAVDEVPRAMVVDGSLEPGGGGGGDVWIGLHRGQAVVHVDGETGAPIERIELPGLQPYAAAADDRGLLYFASQAGEIASLDRATSPPSVRRTYVNLACYSTYGIATVGDGQIFGTGYDCDQVYRVDLASGTVRRATTTANARSVALLGSTAYVPHTDGHVSVIDVDTLAVRRVIDLWALGASPIESIGAAVDSAGTVWIASSQSGTGPYGLASRIDPATGTVVAQVPLGLAPHVQGDATGRALRGEFVASGSATARFLGCTNVVPTGWQNLFLDATLAPGSSVRVEVRYGSDVTDLEASAFTTLASLPGSPASPYSLAFVPDDFLLEVRLTLTRGERDSSPVVRQIGIQYDCVGNIE